METVFLLGFFTVLKERIVKFREKRTWDNKINIICIIQIVHEKYVEDEGLNGIRGEENEKV